MNSVEDHENRQLANAYRALLRACKTPLIRNEDKKTIRKAFNFALNAHKGVRRKSGEPYIFHPLSVATIVAKEIGLGTKSIICALLHDVVEDTEVTLEEIEAMFGPKVAQIIDGLTKISGFIGHTQSIQAENFRKILLTLSEDVRVILIKIADRLHNMRTLESISKQSQLKIASETIELFAPLAHRLGLYTIKTELEDLSLKYTEPAIYQELDNLLRESRLGISKYIKTFIKPIADELTRQEIKFEIRTRFKSVFSVYKKMQTQNVPFERIYDLFAIRIIIDEPKDEKAVCWRAYSIVTDYYQPNPDRLRDWLSTPKINGYESLQTTVMGPHGRWVEVQIRTQRMDDIAERGYAAHWKYKEGEATDSALDEWIKKVGELLRHTDDNAIEFFNDFKLNLFSREVYVFTPKGKLVTLPANSTALDFAFEIHSLIGLNCLGAKINSKLVPLSMKLSNGDQVEIITSKKVYPTEEWLDFVTTAKAKSAIKRALKEKKIAVAEKGKDILSKKLGIKNPGFNSKEVNMLMEYFQYNSEFDFYYNIGINKIDPTDINNALKILKYEPGSIEAKSSGKTQEKKQDIIFIGGESDLKYSFAACCNPIPGDEIFGFVTVGEGIMVHRTNCPQGIKLMANYGYRIVEAKWAETATSVSEHYPVGIRFNGFDIKGLMLTITEIVSKQLNINMRSINAVTNDGAFEGYIIVDVFDTNHLEELISRINKVEGIDQVSRFHVEDSI